MRKITLILILIVHIVGLSGQVLMNKDSLLKLLPKAIEDTNAVNLYFNIGFQYELNQPEVAKSYYIKARKLSNKLNYNMGLVNFAFHYAYILNMQNKYDSALFLDLQMLKVARNISDSLQFGKLLFNIGVTYTYMEDYENAVIYFEEGKKIFDKYGNDRLQAKANDIMQGLYYQMHNYKRAIDLEEKALSIFRKTYNPKWLATVLTNLGTLYSSIGQYDKAKPLFTEALAIGLKINAINVQCENYLNLGAYYIKKGEYENIKPLMENALPLSVELKLYGSETRILTGFSIFYTYKKDYNKAENYSKKALSLSYQYNLKAERVEIFTQLSKLAYTIQNMKLGDYYSDQSSLLSDSLLDERIQKTTLNLEKKYETAKKEAQIHQLLSEKKVQELTIQKKNLYSYLLIGALIAVCIILSLSYRNYKHKQKLHQQQLAELITERQLETTEAVLKGEEQERSRIAKDLHDGLGGLLSGIKFSFTTMKGNLVMTPENHQAFERSMDMLDSSIKEMRRVAHNMMPEALLRFGLDSALKDFCNDINQSGALKVNYQSIGIEGIVLEETTSITLYRIVQELLNNTMKHANAASAIVQITNSDKLLTLTVEDDGRGFDINKLKEKTGIGWVNIQNRVDFLKGKLDITSKECEGTSVQIELNV